MNRRQLFARAALCVSLYLGKTPGGQARAPIVSEWPTGYGLTVVASVVNPKPAMTDVTHFDFGEFPIS